MKAWALTINSIYGLVVFISFLYLISIKNKEGIQKNLSRLYLYPSVTLFLAVIYLLYKFDILPYQFFFRINFLSIVFNLCFLYYFIEYEIRHQKLIKISRFIFFIFLTLLLYCQIAYPNDLHLSLVTCYVGVFFISLLYLIDVLISIPNQKLFTIPSFWIILGILTNSIIAIPTFPIFFYLEGVNLKLNYALGTITILGNIIMYLSFVKGVLCLKKVYH
jgi:hypothetical protein